MPVSIARAKICSRSMSYADRRPILRPVGWPMQSTCGWSIALRIHAETLLALVEGWVAVVAGDAIGERLPGAAALGETLRRRRATGGPAEQTFATLVGLELRPRKLRAAAELWQTLTDEHGMDARDAIWAHPDLVPTAEDLDDPKGFAARAAINADSTDDVLAELDDTDGKQA